DGPIPGDALDRIRAAGLEPVQYLHPDTYIAWGHAADRERLRGKPHVRWTGDFAPADRVQPEWRERRGEMLDMRVLIYRGAHVETVVAALSEIGTGIGPRPRRGDRDTAPCAKSAAEMARRTDVSDRITIAGFRPPGALIRLAAAIPGVYSIQ